MKIDLSGKVAIVTGGAVGIGKACAKVFLENGARVVIADIQEAQGQQTAAELSGEGDCRFLQTDVTSPRSVENTVETTVRELGRIDIFVNNAGVSVTGPARVEIDKFPEEVWEKVLKIDLDGLFYCSRAASRVMIQQNQGRIVNIGSVMGSIPARKQIAYVAAKAAVHNMTKAMALELAPHGINVNAVAPGSIVTQITEALFYGKEPAQVEFRERMLSHVPLGRPGKPEDVANAVLFLCGEESSYITGHILTVDGGWTCGYSRDF